MAPLEPREDGKVSVTPAQVGEQLFDIAPDAFVIVDDAGVIRMVNAQAEVLFGYAKEELEGRNVDVLVPEPARAVHPEHRAGYVVNPRTRPMGAGLQLSARRKDGSEFPCDIALSSLTTPEGLLVIAAIRDISDQWAWAERTRLQAQLHQAQRLESVGQLAGGIAHDFNNLLAVILNYAGFVADALREQARRADDDLIHDVEQIVHAAERAAALTHQLLIFSRREVIKPQVLDLNAVVGDLSRLLQRTIGEHVALHTSLDAGLWRVNADPSQIEQVLVNLAVNARDAMSGGGRLEITTDNVELDVESTHYNADAGPGRWVRLTVSDTGTGMPSEVAERAFEPFFTTKPRGEGSGLGLATVYGIVTQAGGHVRLYSEPGLGTTVRIYLRAVDEKAAAPSLSSDSMITPGQGETVLLAEDEEAVREMTRRILVRNGYRVLATASGDDAVRLASDGNQKIDLLLTDVVMPGMSGKELSERVTKLRPDVRTLFMSGYGQEIIVHRGVVEEGVRLLEKPFSARSLLARVREALADDPGRKSA